MTQLDISIRLLQHTGSDLLVAVSDEMEGLMVPGRSLKEITAKLPEAIREILEAEGKRVVNFHPIKDG